MKKRNKRCRKSKKSKYETWKWNFGQSPKYDFYNEKKFAGGTVEVNIKVEKGVIKRCEDFGDFFWKGRCR